MVVLYFVPNVHGVAGLDVVASGLLNLDVFFDRGFLGVAMRRLKLMSHFDSSFDNEYIALRKAVLGALLNEFVMAEHAIVVTSHSEDIDIVRPTKIVYVDLVQRGRKALSVAVHGDAYMLPLEMELSACLLGDTIDEVVTYESWSQAAYDLQSNSSCDAVMTVPTEQVIVMVLSSMGTSGVSSRAISVPFQNIDDVQSLEKYPALARFMWAVKPLWRDALVTMFDGNVNIVEVTRMPWYAAYSDRVKDIRVDLDVVGGSLSMSGIPIEGYVEASRNGGFQHSEIVGTWASALLCDEVVAAAAYERNIASLDNSFKGALRRPPVMREVVGSAEKLYVPVGFEILYSAVPQVNYRPWKGSYDEQGALIFYDGWEADGWAPSIKVANIYYPNTYSSVQLKSIQLGISRFHSLGAKALAFIKRATSIDDEVGCDGTMDIATSFLPGLSHLGNFCDQDRWYVYMRLGIFPKLSEVLRTPKPMNLPRDMVAASLMRDYRRYAVMAGTQRKLDDFMSARVGSPSALHGHSDSIRLRGIHFSRQGPNSSSDRMILFPAVMQRFSYRYLATTALVTFTFVGDVEYVSDEYNATRWVTIQDAVTALNVDVYGRDRPMSLSIASVYAMIILHRCGFDNKDAHFIRDLWRDSGIIRQGVTANQVYAEAPVPTLSMISALECRIDPIYNLLC